MIVEPKVTLLASTCIEVNKNDWESDSLSEWMETCPEFTAADFEMQEVAGMIRDELHEVAPNIFPKEVDE